MAVIGNFNLNEMPKSEGFDPVPAGEYQVRIKACDVKATKDETGQYIKMTLEILGPSHAGRVIFSNLNIRNKSSEAERIGLQQLGEVMTAIGVQSVQDTDQLIGGVMMVKVVVKPAQGEWSAGNEVKGYKPLAGGVVQMPKVGGGTVAPGAPAQEAPWIKPKGPFEK